MGTFNASLRTIGDSRGLRAVVAFDNDRIAIRVGDHEIGDWAFDDVSLEATGESTYRMEAEGDHILLELEDVPGFQLILDERSKMRTRRLLRPAVAKRAKTGKRDQIKTAPAAAVEAKPAPKTRREQKDKAPKAPKAPGEPNRAIVLFDRVIAAAERRWGSLLPAWVFTRATAMSLVILAVTSVFLPGLISVVILVLGLLGVLFGAVAYTDLVVSSRWLPGRMTAMHLLLGGMGLVILGVFLGILA
jgi:hypothetical protein